MVFWNIFLNTFDATHQDPHIHYSYNLLIMKDIFGENKFKLTK